MINSKLQKKLFFWEPVPFERQAKQFADIVDKMCLGQNLLKKIAKEFGVPSLLITGIINLLWSVCFLYFSKGEEYRTTGM